MIANALKGGIAGSEVALDLSLSQRHFPPGVIFAVGSGGWVSVNLHAVGGSGFSGFVVSQQLFRFRFAISSQQDTF